MADVDFVHQPHPHTERRKLKAPPRIADEHVGLNGRLAATITRNVGTMWAVYIAVFIQITWMVLATLGFWRFARDPYPFAFLLFLSNRGHPPRVPRDAEAPHRPGQGAGGPHQTDGAAGRPAGEVGGIMA